MSTPEIRAISIASLAAGRDTRPAGTRSDAKSSCHASLLPLSSLALLVARVGADDPDRAVAADHLALLAHLLDRRTDLHADPLLLVPVGDATPAEVVGSELDLHLVAGEDPDVVHPHLPGDVGEHLVPVLELDTEHGVRKRFDHRSFHQDRVVLGLRQCCHHLRGSGDPARGTSRNYISGASEKVYTRPICLENSPV